MNNDTIYVNLDQQLMQTIVVIIGGSIFVLMIIFIIIYFIYEYKYFKSEKFLSIKKGIKQYIDECNQLNEHIEELKMSYINFRKIDYGQADYYDNSLYNYKRPELKNISKSNNVCNCSITVCRNAQLQPFKYICKYFNIRQDEKTLENFEEILNNFSAAEQGKFLLKNKKDEILASIQDEIPFLIRTFRKKKVSEKLGFKQINLNQLYFPKFTFQYVSSGGNSSMKCDITFDINNLDKFIQYLSDVIKFRQSVAGQRALMTSTLREKIKKRDKYTCRQCGLSTTDEPNLLLEIDHIIPLSKNGKTTEENLQTLCWKCNRKKVSKIVNQSDNVNK